MEIQGLQKMTLLDYPGKVACTVFLGGCDFRCPFCHNGELVLSPAPAEMNQEELLAFLKKRQGLLDGVCITGGEPLLRPDLPQLLEAVKALGYPVKLDTNGSHPRALVDLVERKLVDYVAMDVKNSPERYPETVGVPGLDVGPIRESVGFLLEGLVDYEFRTTVVPGTARRRQFSRHWSLAFRGEAILFAVFCRPGHGDSGGAAPLGPGSPARICCAGAALGAFRGAAGRGLRKTGGDFSLENHRLFFNSAYSVVSGQFSARSRMMSTHLSIPSTLESRHTW